MSVGVADDPVINPMPAEYDIPTTVRKSPIPTPLATLIEGGITFTSHWRMPIKERKTKMKPSTKTAVSASR
jgi:hypothetical protein